MIALRITARKHVEYEIKLESRISKVPMTGIKYLKSNTVGLHLLFVTIVCPPTMESVKTF